MRSTFKGYLKNNQNPKLEDVKRLELRGADDYENLMFYACRSGNLEISSYILSNINGNREYICNFGLFGVCEGVGYHVSKKSVLSKFPIDLIKMVRDLI